MNNLLYREKGGCFLFQGWAITLHSGTMDIPLSWSQIPLFCVIPITMIMETSLKHWITISWRSLYRHWLCFFKVKQYRSQTIIWFFYVPYLLFAFRKLLDFQQYFPVVIDTLYPVVNYFVLRFNRFPKPDSAMYSVVLFYIFYRQYDKKSISLSTCNTASVVKQGLASHMFLIVPVHINFSASSWGQGWTL